jgi:hypothetical protein
MRRIPRPVGEVDLEAHARPGDVEMEQVPVLLDEEPVRVGDCDPTVTGHRRTGKAGYRERASRPVAADRTTSVHL